MQLSKRQTKLFQLLDHQADYCTINQIAQHLGVSKRSVHYDLAKLHDFFLQQGKELKTKPSVGVKIVTTAKKNEHKANNFTSSRLTVDARRVEILAQLLFEERIVTQTELAERYFVSKSSIQNDLRSINQQFIELKTDHDGTYIATTEVNWQKALFKFNQYISSSYAELSDKARALNTYYPQEIIDFVNKLISRYILKTGIKLSDFYIQNIMHILIILVYRIQKGNHFPERSNNDALPNIALEKMINNIESEFSIRFNQGDMHFLRHHFFLNRLDEINENAINCENIVHQLIAEVEHLTNIPFTTDEQLYKQLLLHVPSMISRLQDVNYMENPYTQEIKSELSRSYNILLIAVQKIETQFHIKFNEDEVIFLSLYFQVAQERLRKNRKILVVCPMGTAASELVINRIKRFVAGQDILESASLTELQHLDLTQFDLILSTVELADIKQKWFKISLFINEKDIKMLLNIERDENNYRQISSNAVFSSDIYHEIQGNYSDKVTLLQDVIDGLTVKNRVKNGYLQSVLEREKLSPTDLPMGIAIPHGISDLVNKTTVVIVKNKRKIKWDNYTVDIIFMINIAPQDRYQTKNIISEIYSVIDSPDLLNTLRNSI
ncbi:hypothetical protein CBG46_02370 [Actinobacillus succinogenes]|uniref:Transcriptional antiterminator, BglG n=1 Tax=Actinobacillus succinogenes (strain ATCC 55618 / DSM 22257 / CCUG 43843 / 130Z) TaxID=339671 RepID=A6VLW1_ACTSZ|nr:BglG family transcription antiterminator [Actinobacillus succinogenes]ABR73958.1 transcriptional antiterminator, BglG [Actinobacillus succinogenes 130Z]PHI39599.1 hypothetical protein CBG46_02370 [Actinobacillus succinogenes]